MAIWFSAKLIEWCWLSNLHLCRLDLDGLKWKSVEHYYQAQKYVGQPAFEAIRGAKDGFAALKAGSNRSLVPRPDWKEIKLTVMKKAIAAKFNQNTALVAKLIATGDHVLCHQSNSDLFWGCNPKGEGENHLGKILMEVRQDLQMKSASREG